MADQEARAKAMMDAAEKKQNSFSFLEYFGTNNSKFEEAAEMYTKAANLFKIAKKWDAAADAFGRCAAVNVKLNNRYEAATNFINAGTCLKKENINESVRYFNRGIELFTEEGKFTMAAKYQKEIAETLEAEMDLQGAMDAYQIAADYYEGEGSQSTANTCLLKVSLFSAQLEKYEKAIEIYEKVAHASIDNNLLKWSVKDYLFRAGLCHLALDVEGARRALERYKDLDITFATSREGGLLGELLEAIDGQDVEKFTSAVVEFDSISKLDPWKTTMLLRIKNSFSGVSLT